MSSGITLLYRVPESFDIPAFLAQCRNEFCIPVRSWKQTDRTNLFVECDPFDLDPMISQAQAFCTSCNVRFDRPTLLQVFQDARRVFEAVPPVTLLETPYRDISGNEVTRHVETDVHVLLITTTENELKALRSRMKPLNGQTGLLRAPIDSFSIRIGQLGMYKVAHVQCDMGSGGRRGSALTVEKALQRIKPKAVLILGIAFGVDQESQRLGDVLIAESILPYDLRRVGPELTVHRGQDLPCGVILSARFRDLSDDWNFPTYFGAASRHVGEVLSGDVLIDNRDFRDALLQKYPTAIGGEMEGAGAYAAAHGRSVEVILIKGICDWADGHKSSYAQQFAALSAVSLTEHVLSKPDVLADIGCYQIRGAHPSDATPRASAWNRLLSVFGLNPGRGEKSNAFKQQEDEETVIIFLRVDGPRNDVSSYLKVLKELERVCGARVKPQVIRRGSIIFEIELPTGAYSIIRSLYDCGELSEFLGSTVLECRIVQSKERFLAQSDRRQAQFAADKRTVVCHLNKIAGFDVPHRRAADLLAQQTTSELRQTTVYVTEFDGMLYLHSNFVKAGFQSPTKIATTECFQLTVLLYNIISTGEDSVSPEVVSDLHRNYVKYFVDACLVRPSGEFAINIGDAKNVIVID